MVDNPWENVSRRVSDAVCSALASICRFCSVVFIISDLCRCHCCLMFYSTVLCCFCLFTTLILYVFNQTCCNKSFISSVSFFVLADGFSQNKGYSTVSSFVCFDSFSCFAWSFHNCFSFIFKDLITEFLCLFFFSLKALEPFGRMDIICLFFKSL